MKAAPTATVFNGFAQIGVEEDYTATIAALTYVTPWKILGGTYAVAVVPSVVAMDVDVGIGIPHFTGPLGFRTFGPFNFRTGDTELALGDTAFAPLVLGWNAGNFHWNVGVFGFAPTGDYSKTQLANTSLNHWAVMNRIAATYFDPKTGWQVNGAAIYSVNWENPATDYETGNILNLEGAITKNFGRLGIGAVGYAMIQTTGDSGAGARLGSFESRVYGAGPIVTYTTQRRPSECAHLYRQVLSGVRRREHVRGPRVRCRLQRQVLALPAGFRYGLPRGFPLRPAEASSAAKNALVCGVPSADEPERAAQAEGSRHEEPVGCADVRTSRGHGADRSGKRPGDDRRSGSA